jgi:Rrf2 family protein
VRRPGPIRRHTRRQLARTPHQDHRHLDHVAGVPPAGQNVRVHISAKVEYAMRALLELALSGEAATAETLAEAQHLPTKFLSVILVDLRRAGIIENRRGTDGGYRLARPADRITVADVMRGIDGPLAEVRGLRPEMATYEGPAEHLQDVWIATRASLRAVLDGVTIDQIIAGRFSRQVAKLIADPGAWVSHVRLART